MKIMIGMDDSPHSEAALEFVRTMPWPKESRAIVASSVRPIMGPYSELYAAPISEATDEAMEEEVGCREELVARARRKLEESGIPTETRVLRGDPRQTLIDLMRSEDVDLIVVGSHGRTGLPKLLLGSVASHLVSHAPCTVLVVRRTGNHR